MQILVYYEKLRGGKNEMRICQVLVQSCNVGAISESGILYYLKIKTDIQWWASEMLRRITDPWNFKEHDLALIKTLTLNSFKLSELENYMKLQL